MIFHICPPDNKFIPPLIERLEQIRPGLNRCIFIKSDHYKNTGINLDKRFIAYYGPLNSNVFQILKRSKCQGVIVHTLNDDILEISLSLPRNYPVFWRSWGPDIHDLIYRDSELLLPATRELLGKNRIVKKLSIKLLRPVYYVLTGIEREHKQRVLKKTEFLNSVNFISTTTKTEFRLLKNRIPAIKAEYMTMNYRVPGPDFYSTIKDEKKKGNVMIGHSGYPSLNHAGVLQTLKELEYPGWLVLPVSYGNPDYINRLSVLGNRLFPGQISFLKEFMKFEKYLQVIDNCSSFILNSRVQSGGGNIILFLQKGADVYLRNSNPAFQDYKEAGIKLFTVEDDLKFRILREDNLSMKQKRENNRVVREMYNEKKEKENAEKVINALLNE